MGHWTQQRGEVVQLWRPVLASYQFVLTDASELRAGEDGPELGDGRFRGRPLVKIPEATAEWFGMALSYNVAGVQGRFYCNLWSEIPGTAVAWQIDEQAPYYAPPGHREGEWLELLLIQLGAAAGAEYVGYGSAFEPLVVPTAAEAMAMLQRGDALQFAMVRADLCGAEEMEGLRVKNLNSGLRYFPAGDRYHVLSSLGA